MIPPRESVHFAIRGFRCRVSGNTNFLSQMENPETAGVTGSDGLRNSSNSGDLGDAEIRLELYLACLSRT